MDLIYTQRDLLDEALTADILGEEFERVWQTELLPVCKKALSAVGITDRVPFVLRPDGSIDEMLSNIFLILSGQVPGRTSLQSYGRHAMRFLCWMSEVGQTFESLDAQAMATYRRYRLVTEGVSPRSWNAEAAALKSFLDASVIAQCLNHNPCSTPILTWYAKGGSATDTEPKFITLSQYKQFRDIGLERGRYALRNAAFGDLILSSSMRLDEANSFRHQSLPEAPVDRSITYRVMGKGSKWRNTTISKSAVASMQAYRDLLRPDQIARAMARGTIALELDKFWLNQSSTPMENNGWNVVFTEAGKISGIQATPHTLRHTSAVYLLSRFIQLTIGSTFRTQDVREEAKRLSSNHQITRETVYKTLFGDPLRRLQKRLGHSSYETTFIYVDVMASNDLISDEALSVFDEVLDSEVSYDNTN